MQELKKRLSPQIKYSHNHKVTQVELTDDESSTNHRHQVHVSSSRMVSTWFLPFSVRHKNKI